MKMLAIALAVGIAGISGFFVGSSTAPGQEDARQVATKAEVRGFSSGFVGARQKGQAKGRAQGRDDGQARGSEAGSSAGKAAAKREAEAAAVQAATQEQAAATWPSDAYAQCEAAGGQVGQAPDEWGTGAGIPQCVP